MNLNVDEIKKIAKKSHTAEIIATSLAMRERLSHNTMLERFKTTLKGNGERIDDKEYVTFWKSLEASGVGRIVTGRGKTPTYFEWFYSLKDIGQLAIGEPVKPIKIDSRKPYKARKIIPVERTPQTFIDPKVSANVERRLFIPLQDGSLFEIVLGPNVSKVDAQSISKAIASI